MTSPGTFERVYSALKQKLRQGVFSPGERLEPAALSDELFASVTPIRDALHRLTGERLVEAPRHEGFRVPSLSETRLRHLYAWHRDLLMLAIMRRRPMTGLEESGSSVLQSSQEQLHSELSKLARATGNPEISFALESVRQRLEPLAGVEDLLLKEVEAESRAIVDALNSGDARLLRKRLLSYHRRRERIVPQILELAQAR